MAENKNLNGKLTVNSTEGIRVTGITSGTYLELSGNLPGYTNGQYPVIKSAGTIHFANNDKYGAYLEGANTYFGVLDNARVTKVLLNTGGNSYLTGGNVGIGTTSPDYKLDVSGDVRATGNLRLGSTGTQNFIAFAGTTGDSTGNYSTTYIGEYLYSGTERSELILYKGNDGHSSTSGYDRIRMIGANLAFDVYNVAQTYPSDLAGVAALSTTRAMTIVADGKVGIGVAAPADLLHVDGTVRIGSTAYIAPVGQSMDLRKVNAISFAPNNGWNDPTYHGIMSTNSAGNNADSISINSYNDITLRLDANSNDSASYLRIMNNSAGNNTGSWFGYNGSVWQNRLWGYLGVNAEPLTANYPLNMGGSIHMNSNNIHYTNELHFHGNTRFISDGDRYLRLKSGSTINGGLRLYDSSNNLKGYGMYWDGDGNGVLNSSGSWGLRLYPGNSHTSLYFSGSEKLKTENYGARTFGDHRVDTNLYLENNHGSSIVGAYSSTRYQGVFAMGDAYKLSLDGTSPGTLYGIAWTHSNVGGQSVSGLGHQMLVMSAGTTRTAIGDGIWTPYDIKGARFVDYNDGNYYVDPAGSSKIRKLDIVASGAGWNDGLNLYSSDGSNEWNLLVDNGNADNLRFAYNNAERVKFEAGGDIRLYGNTYVQGNLTINKSGTDSYITFPAQTNDAGYIRHYESNNTARMYFSVSDDSGTTDYFAFGYSGNVDRFRIYSNGTFLARGTSTIEGNVYGDSFIDRNDNNYYLNPADASRLLYIDMPYRGNGTENLLLNNGGSENWNVIDIRGGNNENGIGFSSSGNSVFGRNNLSFHVASGDSVRFHSSGWDTLFEVAGSTGNAWLKGNLGINETNATARLHVVSDTADSDVLAVDGVNGRLFTVTDSLDDSLFSVNTIAGLPVMEAFADQSIKLGPFTAPVEITPTGELKVDGGTNLGTAVTGASVSNDTITFTRANGSTFAVTTSDADTNTWRPVDDTPVDGNTTTSISSNWAFDNVKTAVPANAVFTDTVNTFDGAYSSLSGLPTLFDGAYSSLSGLPTLGTAAAAATGDFAAASHNHTSLTGITSLGFAAQSSDAASITTTINGSGTYFDFNLTDDNNNDWWRWRFTPSGSTVYDAMVLKPVSNGNANLIVSGNISADNIGTAAAAATGDFAAASHNHDGRYYTETEVNNLLTLYQRHPDQIVANTLDPEAITGTWVTADQDDWGSPRIGSSQARYTDGTGYIQFLVPGGTDTAYLSQLTWSDGGYVDVYGIQSDGGAVFLRRINTKQNVENSNEGAGGGNPNQHDGSTVTLAATGLGDFASIRLLNRSGRFHLTGLGFTSAKLQGAEGTGMVHPAQLSTTSGLNADTVDGLHSSSFMQLNAGSVYVSAANNHSKYRMWGNDAAYAIGMHSGMTVGAVADYATTFTMNDDTNRGWVWRHTGQAATAGVASMTAYGDFTAQTIAAVDSIAVGNVIKGHAFGANSTIGAATGYEFDLSGGVINCSTLQASGDVTAFSDRRLKENIKPIEGALEKVLKLQGVTYTRNDSEDKSTKIGFIAQDVKEVVPEVVAIQNREGAAIEDVHTVSYANMVAMLTEAIKEQQKQIDELKTQLNGLTK